MPIYGQRWLIDPMIHLGYEPRTVTAGLCYGFARMACQAYLVDDLQHFDNRVTLIAKLSKTQISKLPDVKYNDSFQYGDFNLSILELRSFCDGVHLLQAPHTYTPHIIEQYPALQAEDSAISLVRSVSHSSTSSRDKHVITFNGIFSRFDLATLLTLLEKNMSVNLAFVVATPKHAIALLYEAKRKQWLLYDANAPMPMRYNNTAYLADCIFQQQMHECCPFIVMYFKLIVRQQHEAIINRELAQLAENSDWQYVVGISKPKARFSDKYGFTLLHDCARRGLDKRVAQLLIAGADVNKLDQDGSTPLFLAVYLGHLPVVKALLAHGADPDVLAVGGTPLITVAALFGYYDILLELINYNAELDEYSADGLTALQTGVATGRYWIVQLLVIIASIIKSDISKRRLCIASLSAVKPW